MASEYGPPDGTSQEREWARAHFQRYLLHPLNHEEDERLHSALVLVPGLNEELDVCEADLIDRALNGKLPDEDRKKFEQYYERGPESSRLKVAIARGLRIPDLLSPEEQPAPAREEPEPSAGWRIPWLWRAATVFAAILLVAALAVILQLARQNSRLRTELARRPVGTPNDQSRPPETPPNPIDAQTPRIPAQKPSPDREQQQEQPAGETGAGGILLPAARPGVALTVATVPLRLVWTPVPDYRSVYRIRIRDANGREETSAALTPASNAIEYAPAETSGLVLPWSVSILGPGESSDRVLAQYFIRQR